MGDYFQHVYRKGSRVGTLRVGDVAPDFDVQADDGHLIRLRDLRGKWVILYWYPKSDTPG